MTAAPDDDSGSAQRSPADMAKFWGEQIDLAKAEHKDFWDDGDKIIERYRSGRAAGAKRSGGRKFNILYANTEVLGAALYGRSAKPSADRRFTDRDPVGRQAGEVIERSLIYVGDVEDVDQPIEAAIQDYLLPGRGIARIEYEPEIGQTPMMDPVSGAPALDDDGQPQMQDFVADQKLRDRYVYWRDFICSPARAWPEVWWIAFRHTYSRDELREEIYGEKPPGSRTFGSAEDVPLNWAPDAYDKRTNTPESVKKAEVWEIWHKPDEQRIWFVEGHPQPLRVDEDPYQLEHFWPMAEPLRAYWTTDSLIPQAEFHAYQDQADDLDAITARITNLTRALKRRGVYDKSVAELRRLAQANDNEFIPVENYASLAQKGGLAASFQTEDISLVASVLLNLYQQAEKLIQAIWQITGIADIMRGDSDPDETLGAQRMKAQFGSQRLKRRQRRVQKWIRDTLRLKAEIISKHFQPDILSRMTNLQVTPEVMQVIRDDAMRGYRIDIETDSTVFEDQHAEQASRTQMVTQLTEFVVAWAPMIQGRPELLPLAFETLNWAVRAFPSGRELEDVIDETAAHLQQIAQQAAMNPQPNPRAQIEQTKAQAEALRAQADVQKAQVGAQAATAKAQADIQSSAIDLQARRESHAMDQQARQTQHAMEMDQIQQQAAVSAMQAQQQPVGQGVQPDPAGAGLPDDVPPPFADAVRHPSGAWIIPNHFGPGRHARVDRRQ